MKSLALVILVVASGTFAQAKATLPAEAREILTEQGTAVPTEVAEKISASTSVAALTKTDSVGSATGNSVGSATGNSVVSAKSDSLAAKDDKANLKESEIPLNFDKKKEAASESNPIARFFFGMGIVALLAAGGYYYVRKHSKPGQRKNAPQIKVLTQHWLGPKKSLAIIRVAGESILIGVTEQNISMIKSLALLDEEIPADAPDNFSEVLEESTNRTTRTPPARETAQTMTSAEDEEFQMGGLNQIKDAVQRRLKGMRNWQ